MTLAHAHNRDTVKSCDYKYIMVLWDGIKDHYYMCEIVPDIRSEVVA